MTFHIVLVQIAAIVSVLLFLAALAVIGPRELRASRRRYRERCRAIAPYAVGLGIVLLINRLGRRLGPELSWIIGWNVTGSIYAVEGTFVAELQALASPPLTAYFSFAYIHGYIFLLIFPLLAYFVLEEIEPLHETILAYTFNYGIGLVCYIVFIAYGPRNLMPELVDSLLYTTWPESQFLTTIVNVNSNVFPSLHASLALTVAAMAYRTRGVYPRWWYLAVVLAASVIVATMYLGIHWALDVIAGAALAGISVYAATRTSALLSRADSGQWWVPAYVDRASRVVHQLMKSIR